MRSSKLRDVPGGARRRARLGRFWSSAWDILAMVIAMASVAYVAAQLLPVDEIFNEKPVVAAPGGVEIVSLRFRPCSGPIRITCVVDGDTIWLKGQKIRIADIDTPEVFSPGCARERELGTQATARLQDLLNAGPIEIVRYERDTDVYGRKLRVLRRDGHSIGATLVAEGLARKWDGGRHSWCL